MANEKEVKAQVRLRFWNVNKERMTATRNIQVTVKKGGGLTLKTLEGLLARADAVQGDKVSHDAMYRIITDVETLPAYYHIDKVCRDGRRSPTSDGRFKIDPGKRHLLSPGRFKLAALRACCSQEEV
jgi:hypothetical protein